MVNELRHLLRDNVTAPPPEDLDLSAVLQGGRRRVRRRRFVAVGGTAIAAAAVVGLTSLVWPSAPDLDAAGVPRPDAPVLRLADAQPATRGEDYRVLASYTNRDLDADNGQYFDGVTDDGQILFRDGPRQDLLRPRYALMDPATGTKDWLPEPPTPDNTDLWPVDLGTGRLLFTGIQWSDQAGGDPSVQGRLFALVFDRSTHAWHRVGWTALPAVEGPYAGMLAPNGRLYVRVPATTGEPPPGGWPTGPDGEADDADAEGDTYRLWSASLTDPEDVRDERLTVGDVAFTEKSMVWTDSTNGDAGRVHVRDLGTGAEHAFDPHAGDKCNLLSFGATDERVVMSQYCGTYGGGVRDDRVQVLTTDGDQVVTLQDSDVEGSLGTGNDVVTVTSYQRGRSGTYAYDLANDRFLRISDEVSSWSTGGPTPPRFLMWNTPENHGHGAKQWIGKLPE
ncbi:MAG: hypothetical protein ACTHKG_02705 [Nocardioides sp.]